MSERLSSVTQRHTGESGFSVTTLRPSIHRVSTVSVILTAFHLDPAAFPRPLLTLWVLPHPSASITVHSYSLITVSSLLASSLTYEHHL